MDRSQPWYREPWPWLLLVPIVASMIVGFTMLGVAIQTSDGLVSDDYYRQGVLYNEVRTRDAAAQTLGMTADLTIDAVTGDVIVQLDFGDAPSVDRLKGALRHPTFARGDIEFELIALRDGYFQASIPAIAPGARIVQLMPLDESWRITARVGIPLAGVTRLAP